MRYTTVIDISEYPALYKNQTVRLVYLHMCLKSGYHDHDRDLLETSIRRLSIEVGVSVAAIRHALHVLEVAQLIKRQGTVWQVRKFVIEQPITSRAKTKKEAERKTAREAESREREAREAARVQEEKKRNAQWESGRPPFVDYYEDILRRAASGDPDAIRLKETHRATYENILKQLTN